MSFLRLVVENLRARRLRTALTAVAVGIGVMAVVALGILTTSLKTTATEVLRIGNADFTISQKHTDDIVNSSISVADIERIGRVPGVERAIGALIELNHYDSNNPVVVQVGLDPEAQAPFGVKLLEGQSYRAGSKTEVMLGYELAHNLGKHLGDTIRFDSTSYRVVGLYATNVSFGNSTVMMPLSTLQGLNRVAGQVTLGFVKVRQGASIVRVRAAIDRDFPQLTTIQSAQDYGRADRNLTLISAANTGGSILAALIAITGVLNTSLMSFFERIRDFGILRAIGWSRTRVLSLVLGETLVVSLGGAGLGLLGGWAAVNVLQHLSQLRGVFQPSYDAWVFGRSLIFAVFVAFVGALYPAMRAALLSPMEALRRE